MFVCIEHVLEAGAAPGLPVPVGSPSAAEPACVGVAVGGWEVSPWGWQCCQSSGLLPSEGLGQPPCFAGAAAPAVSPGWFPSNVRLATAA